jgi:hypothetical protein
MSVHAAPTSLYLPCLIHSLHAPVSCPCCRWLGGVDETGVEFLQCPAEKVDAPDASFDIVSLSKALGHNESNSSIPSSRLLTQCHVNIFSVYA